VTQVLPAGESQIPAPTPYPLQLCISSAGIDAVAQDLQAQGVSSWSVIGASNQLAGRLSPGQFLYVLLGLGAVALGRHRLHLLVRT
jgi:hypothetical protein